MYCGMGGDGVKLEVEFVEMRCRVGEDEKR